MLKRGNKQKYNDNNRYWVSWNDLMTPSKPIFTFTATLLPEAMHLNEKLFFDKFFLKIWCIKKNESQSR